MIINSPQIFKISSHSARLVTFMRPNSLFTYDFNPKYTTEEQCKILKTLNISDKEQLLNLNVSKAKIKNLDSYRNKKGPFKSLNDILEVEGLSVKVLEKLCEQILKPTSTQTVKTNTPNKRLKQFLAPQLPCDIDIQSSVGIHLAPVGVSWAKLCAKENYIEAWGHQDFVSLPKKMLPTDTFILAKDILNLIPKGDIYVFEGAGSMGLQGQKQAATVSSHNHLLELTSMLLALINTSAVHNQNSSELTTNGSNTYTNKVYFLRSKLSARLFKTLVGTECVSTINTISQLLDSFTADHFSLPCNPVSFDAKLRTDYLAESAAQKELLGQAILLVVAFSDLCVKRHLASLNAVTPGKSTKSVK